MSIRSLKAPGLEVYGVEPAKASGSKLKLQTAQLGILGLLLPILACISALKFGFVYDDRTQIINNPALQSWRNLPLYFTSHVWQYSRPEALVLELEGRRVEALAAYKCELYGYPDQTEVMKRLRTLEASGAPEDAKHKNEVSKAAMSVADSLRPVGIVE